MNPYNPYAPVQGGILPGGGLIGGSIPGGYSPGGLIPGGYGVQATPAPAVEEIDEDVADEEEIVTDDEPTGRFSYITVAATVPQDGKINISFEGLKLDDATDFFAHLGTDEGEEELYNTLIDAYIAGGAISPMEALLLTILGL